MPVAIVIYLLTGVLVVVGLIGRLIDNRARRRKPGHTVTVDVDDDQLTVVDGKARISVRWNDIRRITMITTSRGPWFDDLFYHIVHVGGDLTLPSEANGMIPFAEKLQGLPGFDINAYAQAIRSARNESFVVVVRNDEVSA
jgi:hypothetical protein